MKSLLSIAIILCFMKYGCASQAMSSNPSGTSYYHISYPAFTKMYLKFVKTMIPLYTNLKNDIESKITEFQAMSGPQQFISFPSLISQYIPLYSICRQQLQLQVNGFSETTKTPISGVPNILYSPKDFSQFEIALKLIVKGDGLSLNSIVNVINAFEIAIESPLYEVNGDEISINETDAQKIYNGLSGVVSGNEYLVEALQIITGIKTSVLSYQINPESTYFLTNLFTYMESELEIYKKLDKIAFASNDAFMKNESTSRFRKSLSVIYSQTNSANLALAKYFGKSGEAYQVLATSMEDTPNFSF